MAYSQYHGPDFSFESLRTEGGAVRRAEPGGDPCAGAARSVAQDDRIRRAVQRSIQDSPARQNAEK